MTFLGKSIANITENISIDRLSSYRYLDCDSMDLILSRYIFNVQISESFYPIIAALEISLRNRLYNAVAKLKDDNWLLGEISNKNILSENEHSILLEACKKLQNKKHKLSTSSLIVELTFGFWIHLCTKSYKPKF